MATIDRPVKMRAKIKATLGETSDKLSVLCTSPKINIWSLYKPKNWKGPTITQALKDSLSGFKIDNMVLVHDPPTSHFREDDFNGYKHDARKPSVANESYSPRVKYEGATHGPSNGSTAVRIQLPDTDTFKVIMQEFGITHASLYDSSGVNVGRVAIGAITETNYQLNFPVTLDLSSVPVGSTYSRSYDVYYGDVGNSYKKFRIPGDGATISGKINPLGVYVETRKETHDFLLVNTMAVEYTAADFVANPTGTFTINYLKISGSAFDFGENNVIRYGDFRNKISWRLRYDVILSDGTIKVNNAVVPNWSGIAVEATEPQSPNPYGSYKIEFGSGNAISIPNLDHGSQVIFRVKYGTT